jgi:hypothetical protein
VPSEGYAPLPSGVPRLAGCFDSIACSSAVSFKRTCVVLPLPGPSKVRKKPRGTRRGARALDQRSHSVRVRSCT